MVSKAKHCYLAFAYCKTALHEASLDQVLACTYVLLSGRNILNLKSISFLQKERPVAVMQMGMVRSARPMQKVPGFSVDSDDD